MVYTWGLLTSYKSWDDPPSSQLKVRSYHYKTIDNRYAYDDEWWQYCTAGRVFSNNRNYNTHPPTHPPKKTCIYIYIPKMMWLGTCISFHIKKKTRIFGMYTVYLLVHGRWSQPMQFQVGGNVMNNPRVIPNVRIGMKGPPNRRCLWVQKPTNKGIWKIRDSWGSFASEGGGSPGLPSLLGWVFNSGWRKAFRGSKYRSS